MSLSPNWGLRVDPGVLKILKRIPRQDRERILGVLVVLPLDPYFGDIQKMQGRDDVWRRRVGSYRIFYRVITGMRMVLVFHVERRTSHTYS